MGEAMVENVSVGVFKLGHHPGLIEETEVDGQMRSGGRWPETNVASGVCREWVRDGSEARDHRRTKPRTGDDAPWRLDFIY